MHNDKKWSLDPWIDGKDVTNIEEMFKYKKARHLTLAPFEQTPEKQVEKMQKMGWIPYSIKSNLHSHKLYRCIRAESPFNVK